MSDIDKLRQLSERQNSISINLPGAGIVSLRLPTSHERQMAWTEAYAKCGKANASGCVIMAKRLLATLCLSAWSVTPRMLLAEQAPEEGADDVLQVSPAAAGLFYDIFPEHYELLADKMMSTISERQKAQEAAEKNS